MKVRYPIYNLLKHELRVILLKPAALADIVEQVATCAHLHHKQHVLFCIERFVEPVVIKRACLLDNVRVTRSKKDTHLLCELLLLCRLFKELLVDTLDSNKLTHESMHGQIHLAKRTLP